MAGELRFEQEIPAGPFTLTAKGVGTEGLYGPWTVEIVSEDRFMGLPFSQRFDFAFTTVEGGSAPVTGRADVRIGEGMPILEMRAESELRGDVRVVPPTDDEPAKLVVTATAEAMEGAAEVKVEPARRQIPIFGPGNSQEFEFRVPRGLRASLDVPLNDWGDQLPVIPFGSEVVNGSVRYRQRIEVTVEDDGEPLPGVEVRLVVDPETIDRVEPRTAETGPDGVARFAIESPRGGIRAIRIEARHDGQEVPHLPLILEFAQAWYDTRLDVTAYILALEEDFGGPAVRANGLDEDYREGFLFGGGGVVMQGTGLGSNGKLVKYANRAAKWNGNRSKVANPDKCEFKIVQEHKGARGVVLVPGRSIAVDPCVIPMGHWVEIFGPAGRTTGVGKRQADDTGGGIFGRHIDDYAGPGKAAVKAWGGNFAGHVKYLGPKG